MSTYYNIVIIVIIIEFFVFIPVDCATTHQKGPKWNFLEWHGVRFVYRVNLHLDKFV